MQEKNEIHTRKQGRSWLATIFTEEGEIEFNKAKMYCLYAVGQIEVGKETGREHLQALFHFDSNKRLAALKKIWPSGHFEIPRDVEDCIKYCQKEDTRLRGPFSFGVDPITRKKSNYKFTVKEAIGKSESELQDLNVYNYIAVKKALALVPVQSSGSDNLRGEWYYGKPGVGKSKTVFSKYQDAYIKAQNKWFCGYKGQEIIILDDLDCIGDRQMAHYLKIWSDHYPCTGEIKGGITGLNHKLFIVTSNYTPEELWPCDPILAEAIRRRFKMIHIF